MISAVKRLHDSRFRQQYSLYCQGNWNSWASSCSFFFFFSPCNTYGFFGCCCFVCLLVCCCCSLLSTPCHTALTRKSNSDPAPYSPTQPPTEKLSRSTIGRNLFWQFFVRPYVVQIVTKLVLELTCIFIFWRRWLVPPCVGLFKLMCSELFSWTPTQVLQ